MDKDNWESIDGLTEDITQPLSPAWGPPSPSSDSSPNNDDTQLEVMFFDGPQPLSSIQSSNQKQPESNQKQLVSPEPNQKQLVSLSPDQRQLVSSPDQLVLSPQTISVKTLTTKIVETVAEELNAKLEPFYKQFNETRNCLLMVKQMLEKQMNQEQPVVSVPSVPSGSKSSERESIIVMFIIFFFGFSTNTVTLTKEKDELYLSIFSNMLTVMKHTLITGTSAKSILAKLKFPSKRRADKSCAEMVSQFLSVGDLSSGTVKVTVSFRLFMERCRQLYVDHAKDVSELAGIFAKVDRDWLLNMDEEIEDDEPSPNPLAGKKRFKGTKKIPPVRGLLSIGYMSFKNYQLLLESPYYHWEHGFFSYISTGMIPNQNNLPMEGNFAKFTGFWCFERVVDELPKPVKKVSTRSSKKRKAPASDDEEEAPRSKKRKAPASDDEEEAPRSKKRKAPASKPVKPSKKPVVDEQERQSTGGKAPRSKKGNEAEQEEKESRQKKQKLADDNEQTDHGSGSDSDLST